MTRLNFSGASAYPIESADLQGNAIQIIANNLTVDLQPLFSQSPTMVALPKTTAYQDVIRWDVALGDSTALDSPAADPALYTGFPGIDSGVYQQRSRMSAELTIGARKTSNQVKFDHRELMLAAERGTEAVRNLVDNRIQFAISGIVKALNQKLFTGTAAGNGNMVGFQTIFSNLEYAGISHALADYTGSTPNVDYYPDWRPLSGLGDLSDAAITLNDGHGIAGTLVADTVYSVKTAEATGSTTIDHFYAFDYLMRLKERRYNIIVAHPEIVEQFFHDYRSNLTYNIDNGRIIQAAEGIAVPRFNGRPVIEDNQVPAGTAYFLNTPDIEVQTLSLANSAQDGQMVNPQLNILAGQLAVDTAMTQRYELLVLPQLVVKDTKGLNRLVIQA